MMDPLKRYVVDKSGCWLWTGPVYGMGYGSLNEHKWGHKAAHRLFYERHRGPIPSNRIVCHTCDVPKCVNPEHLYLGTYRDNAVDVVRRKRRKWVAPNKRLVTFRGETRTLSGWQQKLGVPVHARLHRGWTIHRALSTPNRFG